MLALKVETDTTQSIQSIQSTHSELSKISQTYLYACDAKDISTLVCSVSIHVNHPKIKNPPNKLTKRKKQKETIIHKQIEITF